MAVSLRSSGHALRLVSSAKEALRILSLEKPRPPLVILDADLQDLPAAEVLARIRGNPDTAALPVLWLDAASSPGFDPFMPGAPEPDLCLRGPVDPVALRPAVRTLLRLSRDQRPATDAMLELVAQAVGGVIYDWSPSTGQVQRTPGLELVVGTAPNSTKPTDGWWLERVHPEDRASIEAAFQAALASADHYSVEYRVRAEDGSYRFVWDKGLIVRAPDGSALRVVGSTVDVTERKQTELALRESDVRFQTLADSAPVLIWLSGQDKSGIYFNQRWLEFTGRTLEDELGEGWFQVIHPEDLPALDACQQAWSERRPFSTQFRMRRWDGEYRWMLDTGTPRFAEDGAFLGYVGSCVDITAQVESEAAVRASESEFRALFQLAAVGVSQADPATLRFMRVNRKLCEITGYSERELLEMSVHSLLHPEDGEAYAALVAPVLRNEREGWRAESRFIRKDGQLIWVQVDGTLLQDSQGRPLRTLEVIQDITDRRHAQERLRDRERQLSGIIGSAMDALITVDEHQRIVVFNAAAERMFGYTAAELLGESLERLIPERFRADHRSHVEAFGSTGITSRAMGALRPLSALRADGSEFPIEAAISQVSVESGTLFTVIVRDITERQRAETALRESEARLRFALEAGRIGAWEWHIRTGRVAWSQGLEALHGLPPGGFAGTYEAFLALIHPADRERVMEAIRRTIEEDAPYEVELRTIRPDGTVQWIETRARVLRAEDGSPLRLVGVSRDISQQRTAEDALRASEERFRSTFEQAAVGMAHVSVDGRWLRVNQKLCDITGYPREELLRKTFQEITHPDDLQADLGQVEQLLAGNLATYSLEKRCFRRDGSVVWVALTVSLVRDDAGNPEYFISVIEEISSRKATEAQVYATAKRLDRANSRLQVLNEASRAFAEYSADFPTLLRTVVRYASEQIGDTCALRLISQDGLYFEDVAWFSQNAEAEELTRTLVNSFPQRTDEGFSGEAVRTGAPVFIPEIRPEQARRRLKPEYLPILDRVGLTAGIVVPLRGRDRFMGVLLLTRHDPPGRPYTEEDLKLLQELADRAALAVEKAHLYHELQTEARRKDEFLAMLAHELRNPLAPIVSAVEIIRIRGGEDGPVQKQRDVIERNARHLARLVDDLLEVSRINEGKIILREERVELIQVVEQAVTSTRPLIESRRHTLNVSVPPEPIYLSADPTRLVQVFVNLLNNAAKYTDPGGEITLTARREHGEAVVSVRDNGRGMEGALQGKVFELFVQGERTLARTEGGLGVGLTLAKRLVEMHGGVISASSEGVGRGSEFTVRLPAEPVVEPAPLHTYTGPAVRSRAGLRILVVEDNLDAAETLAELLNLWGHTVRVLHDGVMAVEVATTFRPHYILLDIGLPGQDGYTVAQRLREAGALQDTCLIALTGYGDSDHGRRAEEAGFHHLVAKPVEAEVLRHLLNCADALEAG